MIYPQNKKNNNFNFYLGLFFWLALAVLIFFSASRIFLKSVAVKAAFFLMPERAALEESRKDSVFILAFKNLKIENEQLKQILGAKNQSGAIPAKIKFGGGYLFTDTAFLDTGRDLGVKTGDAVVFKNNILIGNIMEVGDNWSKISPIGKLGGKILLRAEQRSEANIENAPFEAEGLGGGEMSAILPASFNLRAGDAVFWAENRDLIAGIIDRVVLEPDGQTAKISLVTPVSLENVNYVTIIPQQ